LARDLLHPSPEEEKRRHKKKRLVQCPNSYFMDVKCPGCYKITTVFSHAQTVVLCVGCSTVLCQPTGGKARLTEGLSLWLPGKQQDIKHQNERIKISTSWQTTTGGVIGKVLLNEKDGTMVCVLAPSQH
ncbi:40S ribosomal protein S27, partial [Nibea albiflora]